jgi:hypothetical protein
VPGPPATAPPDATTAPTPVTGPARISFQPGTVATTLGSAVTVTLSGDNIPDMISAAAQLRYDPGILRVNNILAGELPQRNTPPLTPSMNILNDSGQSDMSVSRGPTAGGISGSGGLFTITFQAVGRGNTSVTVGSVALTGSTGQPINTVAPQPLVVNVN